MRWRAWRADSLWVETNQGHQGQRASNPLIPRHAQHLKLCPAIHEGCNNASIHSCMRASPCPCPRSCSIQSITARAHQPHQASSRALLNPHAGSVLISSFCKPPRHAGNASKAKSKPSFGRHRGFVSWSVVDSVVTRRRVRLRLRLRLRLCFPPHTHP